MLVFSQGQATVERGFSENKMILVEILHMESLIAQRQVCNFMKNKAHEPHTFPMSRSLINHLKAARQRYHIALAGRSKTKINAEKDQKLKAINKEIKELSIKEVTLIKLLQDLRQMQMSLLLKPRK